MWLGRKMHYRLLGDNDEERQAGIGLWDLKKLK